MNTVKYIYSEDYMLRPNYLRVDGMFDSNEKLDHNTRSNGGTLITNFSDNQLSVYEAAIYVYKSDVNRLVISKYAYDVNGNFIPGMSSLHLTETDGNGLSDFWSIFNTLQLQSDPSI